MVCYLCNPSCTWEKRLQCWRYPEEKIGNLAEILRNMNISSEDFTNPMQLSKFLSDYVREYQNVIPLEWWDPIKDFFGWIWEAIQPYVADIGMILVGGLASWFLTGWYRLIGIAPIAAGIYRIYARTAGE